MLLRLLFTIVCACVMGGFFELVSSAQTAPPAPKPAPSAPPTTPKPAPSTGKRAAATYTITVSVTDGSGSPVKGARVVVTGTANREGVTIADGTIRVTGLRPGVYRIRVEHEGFVTLEREVTVRGTSQRQVFDVTLTEAPSPPEAEEPEPATPPTSSSTTPPGEPRSVVIADFVEKNFISGRDPRKEDELGCTASARTVLLQLRDPTKEESDPHADEVLYVVAGEGTLRLGNTDVVLDSSTVAIVPRGTVKAITRKGRNPLILLSVKSGPSCTK
jgi:mannose-6-phosphate isomerase-like protein (cupin superfamily)